MPYVISKCACDNEFPVWDKFASGRDLRLTVKRSVLIRGGQGVMEHHTFITPDNGAITEITEEEAEILKNNPAFMKMVKNGFMTLINSETSAQKESGNMEKGDDSAQLTPEDFAEEAAAAEMSGSELKIGNRKVSSDNAKPSRKRRKN